MSVLTCSVLGHDIRFLTAGLLVCLFGCAVSISVFTRAHTMGGLARIAWVFLTAICAATTIWTTHFVAMLGYRTDIPAAFEHIWTALSVVIAIFGMGLGFGLATVKNNRIVPFFGGSVAGLSIAGMHYFGMLAYRIPGTILWDWTYVAASVAVAVGLSTTALMMLNQENVTAGARMRAMIAFGAGVLGLHFCGMAGVSLLPLADPGAGGPSDISGMVLTIMVVSLIVIATGFATYVIDADTRLRSDRCLIAMAFQVPLTGLPNRRALKDAMAAAFAAKTWFKLMLIDLDHFKGINDTFGHAIGDALLIEVAHRLRTVVGAPDTFAYRLGGDELAITVFSSRDAAWEVAQSILHALKEPIVIDDNSIMIGCSIGLCSFDNAGDAETLMQRADTALYAAKDRGRGQAFCYMPGMLEAATERTHLLAALQRAIELGQFRLEFQPIFNLASQELCGYEALLRWHLPSLGHIPPSKFIPIAEESGLINAIGDWVLDEACRIAQAWRRDLYVAVNVSAVQVRSAKFPAQVIKALARSGLQADLLVIELTETAIVSDDSHVAGVLEAVRILGVRVAMDDFGTGFSSLSHLRQLPLDIIKIDRNFVTSAEKDHKSMAVLRAIMQLGRDLEIVTIGEGVETPSQLEMLRELGCDAVQGYLLGKPTAWPEHAGRYEIPAHRLAS